MLHPLHGVATARAARRTKSRRSPRACHAIGALLCLAATLPHRSSAQQASPQWDGVPPVRLEEGVRVVHTADEASVRVRVLTTGLARPWSLAFLPNGDLLVTELGGRLRLVREGALDPTPIEGVPPVSRAGRFAGLLEVALHPRFAENRLVYLTYREAAESRVVLARARLEGMALVDFEILWRAGGGAFTTSSGSRLLFAPDGTLFMPMGGAPDSRSNGLRAQDPTDPAGKILRFRDDGSAPPDNPFVGRDGHLPELYSLGHRNVMGLAFHPATGELWAAEHAAQGGDEVNVIRAGANYGWPLVSYGREYAGPPVSERPWREDMEAPTVVWVPSIAPSGMMFYTGDRFPGWEGDLFVGALMVGRIERTGHLERIVLNERGEEIARESLLTDLRQRIRDVRQGPDGLIYLLTDEEEGALLRLEPVE